MKNQLLFLLTFFITQSVLADMTCDIDLSDYYAVYEPRSYTCQSGQYLPANTLGCIACPNAFTCDGGTFNFDEDYFQGLDFSSVSSTTINKVCATNFPDDLYAEYEPHIHTCSSGYYLPAGLDACTQCPSGSACSGGTYSFNETLAQGIQSCASGTFASAGSAVCYPHILHVGDDIVYINSVKRTTPSLNIDIDNDGVAEFFINMTTVPTTMNKDSTHYFRVQWEDKDYYICDDTTYPNRE